MGTTEKIDCILVNHQYRDIVPKAWAVQGWRGNMRQQRQHAVVRMDITLKLLRKLHGKYIPEAGEQIKSDIQKLKRTRKLEQWFRIETGQAKIRNQYKNRQHGPE